MKIIYTAIFGDYDHLKDPQQVNPNWKYICITDNRKLESKVFEFIYVDSEFDDKAYMARKVKLQPHVYLPDHDINIWIDASMVIIGNPENLAGGYLSDKGFSIIKHPSHNCTYQEANLCIHINKDKKDVISLQMATYLGLGLPKHNGMVASGIQIRKNIGKIQKFLDNWWGQVEKYSKRDQLSFNYVAWNQSFEYDLMPHTLYKGGFAKLGGHKRR